MIPAHSCPKCGESGWTVGDQELPNLSIFETLTKVGNKTPEEAMKIAGAFKVAFVYCTFCGSVVTATIMSVPVLENSE